MQKLNPNADDSENHVAEKLYTGKSRHICDDFMNFADVFVRFRTSRDIVHALNLKSRSGDASKTSTKAGEEVAAVPVEGWRCYGEEGALY